MGAGANAALKRATAKVKVGKNEVEWVTDAGGLPLEARGTLKEYFKKEKRGSAEVEAQSDAASRGVDDDHGGHVVGHRFVKDQGAKNMFPQNDQFNNPAFKTLENDYARWIDQCYEVEFKHTLGEFDPVTGRPGAIRVDYEVFDGAGDIVHNYSQRFVNEAGRKYPRQTW